MRRMGIVSSIMLVVNLRLGSTQSSRIVVLIGDENNPKWTVQKLVRSLAKKLCGFHLG